MSTPKARVEKITFKEKEPFWASDIASPSGLSEIGWLFNGDEDEE